MIDTNLVGFITIIYIHINSQKIFYKNIQINDIIKMIDYNMIY